MNIENILKFSKTNKYVKFDMTSGVMSQNGGSTWVAQVELGTPSQTVAMMLDTGTLNTWVTSDTCTTDACSAHKSFSPEGSSTFTISNKKPAIESFGPWGKMGVVFGRDVCHLTSSIEKAKLERLSIMLATCYTGENFKELVGDGGLCIPSVPDHEATAILDLLCAQRVIDRPIASFYWDKRLGVGECRMGSVNEELFLPHTLNILPLIKPFGKDIDYLWAVKLDLCSIDGQDVYKDSEEMQLVLDTGSSFFKGASDVIEPLISAVTCSGKRPIVVDNYEMLKSYPVINLTLGGVQYKLDPDQYFVKIKNSWVLAIQVLDGMPSRMLLVGQVFLETVYSIFDAGSACRTHRSVILAEPIHKALNVEGMWQNDFGSVLEVRKVEANGTFQGAYKSDTGATGKYPVVGVADPAPKSCQTVSFSVTWKSEVGAPDVSWHYVSGFTGILVKEKGEDILKGTFLLQREVTQDVPIYEACSIISMVFKRK